MASYWLSIKQVPQFIEPNSCSVFWIDEDREPTGDWGDYGFTSSDQVNAWIRAGSAPGKYNVRVRERRTATQDVIAQDFADVSITHEIITHHFARNRYRFTPFGYRLVSPASGDCGRFDNINPAPPFVDDIVKITALVDISSRWQGRRTSRPPIEVLERLADRQISADPIVRDSEPEKNSDAGDDAMTIRGGNWDPMDLFRVFTGRPTGPRRSHMHALSDSLPTLCCTCTASSAARDFSSCDSAI
jgi:hypothetical protein